MQTGRRGSIQTKSENRGDYSVRAPEVRCLPVAADKQNEEPNSEAELQESQGEQGEPGLQRAVAGETEHAGVLHEVGEGVEAGPSQKNPDEISLSGPVLDLLLRRELSGAQDYGDDQPGGRVQESAP